VEHWREQQLSKSAMFEALKVDRRTNTLADSDSIFNYYHLSPVVIPAFTRAGIMRTPARAFCLSQQGNPHGSLCKTLLKPSGCSTRHTHWLQPQHLIQTGAATIHANSVSRLR
jgi:hypothetical protein